MTLAMQRIDAIENMLVILGEKIDRVDTELDTQTQTQAKMLEDSRLFSRLDQVEEDVIRGHMDNDILSKIDAMNARITESERAMTSWVETQLKVARDLIQTEESIRRAAISEVRTGVEEAHRYIETVGERIQEIQMGLGEIQKEMVGAADVLGHTEHSEDRRRINAKQNAKQEWSLDATVELYGSDAHSVAQELAKLIVEGKREMGIPARPGTVEALEEAF